jgi:hypothetical protein
VSRLNATIIGVIALALLGMILVQWYRTDELVGSLRGGLTALERAQSVITDRPEHTHPERPLPPDLSNVVASHGLELTELRDTLPNMRDDLNLIRLNVASLSAEFSDLHDTYLRDRDTLMEPATKLEAARPYMQALAKHQWTHYMLLTTENVDSTTLLRELGIAMALTNDERAIELFSAMMRGEAGSANTLHVYLNFQVYDALGRKPQ